MNTRKLTRLVLSLLVGTVLAFLSTMPAVAQMRQEQAKLTLVVGQVEVLRKGGTAWQPARLGMLLSAGDEIRAAENSGAELAMVDGSVIQVFAQSRLQIRQLTSEVATRRRTSWFHLVVGIVRYVVVKAAVVLVQARQDVFAISTPTAVVAVRGTEGFVIHLGGETNVGCLDDVSIVAAIATRVQDYCFPGQFWHVRTGLTLTLVLSQNTLAALRGATLQSMLNIIATSLPTSLILTDADRDNYNSPSPPSHSAQLVFRLATGLPWPPSVLEEARATMPIEPGEPAISNIPSVAKERSPF
ncbi:MAG: FecR domain-containing protein [Dehalococcoidia bacterium]